jgi:type II secretory pathway component PulM
MFVLGGVVAILVAAIILLAIWDDGHRRRKAASKEIMRRNRSKRDGTEKECPNSAAAISDSSQTSASPRVLYPACRGLRWR